MSLMPQKTVPITTIILPRKRTKVPTELMAATRKIFAVCKKQQFNLKLRINIKCKVIEFEKSYCTEKMAETVSKS